MKIVIGILLYTVFSGSLLFRKNNNDLNKQNTEELKGISAILIVLGHCTNDYIISDLSFLNIGWYVVAVFFFISGYGISCGYKNKKDYLSGFMKTRFTKVLVPFFIAHIFYIIVKIIYHYQFSLKTILLSFIGINTIVSNSWYCLAVLIFYFVFWVCFKAFKSDLSRFIALSLSIILITVIEGLLYGKEHSHWFISNISFIFGVASSLFNLSERKPLFILILCSLGLVFSMGIIPGFNYVLGYYSYLVEIISCNLQSAFFAVLIITFVPVFQYNNKISSFIGKISYEIYLYHGLFIIIFKRISFISNNFLLFFICVCISTVVLSALINMIDKKAVNSLLFKTNIKK